MSGGTPQNCQICGKPLYLTPEKKRGICDVCARLPVAARCMKCGVTLLAGDEKKRQLCRRCSILEYRCAKCSRRLESTIERTGGICNECKRQESNIFSGKRR